jgi:hypothetical protein
MLNFQEYITEVAEVKKKPVKKAAKTFRVFDMDETLVTHEKHKLRVHVLDPHGNRNKSLSNQEFNNHKLPNGHNYDFSEFKSSEVFAKSAKPILKMIAKLKAFHKSGDTVEILTARSDLDDQEKFARHMKKFGIDIRQIHVRRAGNIEDKKAAEAKAAILDELIKKHKYTHVHFYDDSEQNLKKFLSIHKNHPDVEFNAHLVHYNSRTGDIKITTTTKDSKVGKE